jgi:hypothetical protein
MLPDQQQQNKPPTQTSGQVKPPKPTQPPPKPVDIRNPPDVKASQYFNQYYEPYYNSQPPELKAAMKSPDKIKEIQLGYVPSGMQDPKRVVEAWQIMKATPKDMALPSWMQGQEQQIEQAYRWHELRNKGKPPTEWAYLPGDDPGLSFLGGIKGPPTAEEQQKEISLTGLPDQVKKGEAAWNDIDPSERRNLLRNPDFDITEYPIAMRDQILNDPSFDWSRVPKWQKTYYSIMSNPKIMASPMALAGANAGGLFGLPGKLVGAAAGYGLGLVGGQQYDPTSSVLDQPTLVAGAMAVLNKLSEGAEQSAGYTGQVLDAAIAGMQGNEQAADAAQKMITDPAYRKATWEAGRFAYESSDFMGARNWIPGIARLLGDETAVLAGGGEDFIIGKAEAVDRAKAKGFNPVTGNFYDVTDSMGILQEARLTIHKAILAGEDPKEVIRQIMGEQGQYVGSTVADFAGQMAIDPLEHLPLVTTKTSSKLATLLGNETAARALSETSAPFEAARRYQTLVQTGDVAKGFDYSKMSSFSRFVAGLNDQGQIKAGPLTQTGLLDRPTKAAGIWSKFKEDIAALTPEARAREGATMWFNNIGAVLTTMSDPHEIAKFFTATAKADPKLWAEMGTRIASAPEWYTILPALKDFDQNKIGGLLSAWDLAAPKREGLIRIADILGEQPATFIEDLAKRGTTEQDFQRVVSRLQSADTPEARTLLDEIQNGRFTPDHLKDIVEAFSGDGALYWHPDQWKAALMDSLGSHFDEWAVNKLELGQDSGAAKAFFRTTHLLKSAQSVLLLGGSPGYALQNGLSNMVHRAATGVYGYMTSRQIDTWLDRFGVTPARMEEGVGIGGVVEQASTKTAVKTDAIDQALRGSQNDALGKAQRIVSALGRAMPFNKLSSAFERLEGRNGYMIAMRDMWSQTWRRGKGFAEVTPELKQNLERAGINPGQLYNLIEAGMSKDEVERFIFSRQQGIMSRTLVNDAAQKMGIPATSAARLLEKVGVLDELDKLLSKATTPDKVRTAFRSAIAKAQDFQDMQTSRDLQAMAEAVTNKVSTEGAPAALDVVQQVNGEYFDAWMDHYSRFGEMFDDLRNIPDEAVRNRAIDLNYKISDQEFRRVTARLAANYQGIFAAWKQSRNPKAMEIMAAIAQSDLSMREAYTLMRETRRTFFDQLRDNPNSIEPGRWEADQQTIDQAFDRAFKSKADAEKRMGESLAGIYEGMYGKAAGEAARKWWSDYTKFSDDIVKREKDFRKSLIGMSKEQREAAKQRFYGTDKVAQIAELEKINQEGIARLERVIKRGGGKAGTPTAPRPDAPRDSGPGSDETNQLIQEAEARERAETQARAERSTAVWDVAEEYARVGLPYSRSILQDRFALIGALKKEEYGGIPDLKGLDDERLTPDKVRSILEKRAEAKKIEEAGKVQTALETQAPQTARAPQITENTTILKAIAEHGGLNLDQAGDLTGEKKPKGMPGTFTKKGIGIDEMARLLADDGYPIDVNRPDDPGGIQQATELITRARNKEKIYPVGHDFEKQLRKAEEGYALSKAEEDALIASDPLIAEHPEVLQEVKLETDKKAEFKEFIRRQIEERDAQRQAGIDLLNQHREQFGNDSLVLAHESDNRGIVLHPNTRGEGVQATAFDENGFSGHSIYKTYEEAAAQAYLDHYTQARPDFLDEISETDRFDAGTRWTMLPLEERVRTSIGEIEQRIKQERTSTWRNDFEQATTAGDLTRVYELFETLPEEGQAPTGESWTDYASRIADETAARVENEAIETAVDNMQAQIDRQTARMETRGNAAMTRQLLEEKFKDVFDLTDEQAAAYMEISESLAGWYERATGESGDAFYSRYYEDVVKGGDELLQVDVDDPLFQRKKYTEAELEAMDINELDRLAFGVNSGDVIPMRPDQIKIKYKGDLENPQDRFRKEGMEWARSVDLSEPVQVSVDDNGNFILEDGHHRYFAAQKTGRTLTAEIEVKGNPTRHILKKQGRLFQIQPVNRRMSYEEVTNYARALVRSGPDELRRAVVNEPAKADRIAILDAAHRINPTLAESVARQASDVLFQQVWHGSPHKFDKFTTEKIGSGEGAQVYGWGLYFAGEKKVAEYYRDTLTSNEFEVEIDGQRLDVDKFPGKATRMYEQRAATIDALGYIDPYERDATTTILNLYFTYGDWDSVKTDIKEYGYQNSAEMNRQLPDIERRVKKVENKGQLYQVDIPDDGYILWDRPLSEQPEGIQAILQPYAETATQATRKYSNWQDVTGGDAYRYMASRVSAPGASKALNEAGVNGIKYLDQDSRAQGEGSYNFVVFDDEAIQVLETYYQAGVEIPKGAVAFDPEGIKATIHAFESKDVSTLIHENAHVFRRVLADVATRTDNKKIRADLSTIEEWAGVKDGQWTRDAEEKFARGFERYITDGNAPTPKLSKAFETFKKLMLQIYRSITGSEIDVTISPEVKEVFDRMLGAEKDVDILYQKKRKANPGQMGLFGAGEDMPLFSGTPQTARVEEFTPQPVTRQETMFDMRPQIGGQPTLEPKVTNAPDIERIIKKVAKMDEDQFIPGAEVMNQYYQAYNQGKSSRTTPIDDYPYKPGDWKIDEINGIYGRNVEELRTFDPAEIKLSEEDWTQPINYEGRGDDARRYAEWMKEGKKAPAIHIVQLEDGTFRAYDGHRRIAAAKMAGKKIDAWVSYNMDTGKRGADGKPIYASLTYEGAKHGPAEAYKMWEDRQDRLLKGIKEIEPEPANPPADQGPTTLFQRAAPTETSAFKKWFGDSKVTDDNGRPMVVYHATGADFTSFKEGQQHFGTRRQSNQIIIGKEQTTDYRARQGMEPESPTEYRTIPVYLKIENPLRVEDFGGKPEAWDQAIAEAKAKGHDGLVYQNWGEFDVNGKGEPADSYVTFYPEQVKSTANRGTFSSTDPNILFQNANPLGTMEDASGFKADSEWQDAGWKQHVRPLLDAMQETALEKMQTEIPLDGAYKDMSPAGQAMLRTYIRQVQNDMGAVKNSTIKWGEKQRDFAMLNYNRRYGFDRMLETVAPYQFYYTRSLMTWGMRALDKPAWFANYARIRNAQNQHERDTPERLRNKFRIPAPWLPDWMGDAMYIDPVGYLFAPANFLRPVERMMQDKNYQVIEAERVLQEWAADGQASEELIVQAAQSQSGALWERALAEAGTRREAEISNPFDFMATMFGPAWYLSTPLNLAGIEVPFLSKGEPGKVSTTPLLNTARALEATTAGTWAEPIGQFAALIGKPEELLRKKAGLPEFGEFGDYYVDRQLANMVAEGMITSDQAQTAMIERQGDLFDQARQRVKMELSLRTPFAGTVYAATHEGAGAAAKSFLPSLFGSGLLPAGELEYRGLKQEWNAAWKSYDQGDKTAINTFFEEHPEYEAYLAKGKEPEERLRSYLIGNIWDAYMELGATNQKAARAQMGEDFARSFLDKETRSYDTLDVQTLTQWAQTLGAMGLPRTPETTPVLDLPAGQQKQLSLYDDQTLAVTDRFFNERKEKYPDYFMLEQGYYSVSPSERAAYMLKFPKYAEFKKWRDGYYKNYPELKPILQGKVFKQVDTSNWAPGLEDQVAAYAMTSRGLGPGATSALQQIWIREGRPMDDFKTWLNSQVVPAFLYGQGQ